MADSPFKLRTPVPPITIAAFPQAVGPTPSQVFATARQEGSNAQDVALRSMGPDIAGSQPYPAPVKPPLPFRTR